MALESMITRSPDTDPESERMRPVRYSVASSLDGYIAGPNGEFDWIPMDPEIDFKTYMARFDTVLMGRRTFEVALGQGGASPHAGMRTVVFSRTLTGKNQPGVTIVSDNAAGVVRALKQTPGKDIWLMGGGDLFRSLLEAGVVDVVEIAVVPMILGQGVPLLPAPAAQARLALSSTRHYKTTGIVLLTYDILQS